jgi:hypothetical protein
LVSLLLVLSILFGLASVPGAPKARAVVGYDVGTSTDIYPLYASSNRKIIFDGSYYWVFYWDGTVLAYKYSLDCITWSGSGSAWSYSYYGRAGGACLEYNSPYVYVIQGTGSYSIRFIRGTISGTTITWGSSVQVHSSGTYYNGLGFCRLTSGRLLVTYHHYSVTAGGYYSDNEGVNWSAINDGSSAAVTSTTGGTIVVAMSSAKAMSFWKDSSNGLWYTRYASGAWGTQTQFASTTIAAGYYPNFGVTANGDFVYLAYRDSSDIIRFRYWNDTSSSWSTVEAPYSTNAQAGANPVISVDGNTGIVYVFWAIADVIYYVWRSTSGTWSSRITLISETVDTLSEGFLQCSYSQGLSRILVAYTAKASSPYVVRAYWITTQSVYITHYISGVANSGKIYSSIGGFPANVVNGTMTQYGNGTTITFYGLPANGFIFNGWSGSIVATPWTSSDNPYTVVLYANRTIFLALANSTLTGTATAGDVASGKTFYNTTLTKRTGTLVLTGNATEDDVLAGQTFYNNSTSAIRTGVLVPTGGTVDYLPGIVLGIISLCVVVIWFIGSKKD